jgi:O-antigen ligase
LGVLILPLIPALGEFALVITIVIIWINQYRQIIQNRFNWGLAILGLWLIINCCLAYVKKEAFLGLANFLPFLSLYTALSCLIQKPSQLRRLAWLIILPSFPIVILGNGQLFLHWSFYSFLGWELVAGGVPEGRMSSVFIYANFLAMYLAIALIFTWGLWLDVYSNWRQRKQPSWVLILLTIFAIFNGIGLVLTDSRNAWGIALAASLAFAFYLGWRWLVWGVIGTATAIGWAAIGPVFGRNWLRMIVPAYFWARISDQNYERPVETLRITQWQFCWDLIKQRPLTGWGLRNFTPLYEQKMNVWFGHPHSLFIMLTTEIGIIATLFLCVMVAWILSQAFLLLKNSEYSDRQGHTFNERDKLILFTYILAFAGCIVFNISDVTIFDLRVNTISWIIFSAISGMVFYSRKEYC